MAETDSHVTLIAYLLGMLRSHFRQRGDVYVGANMFLYYLEGRPRRRVAPDLFVVFGVPTHKRRTWKVWEEGKGPEVVFEFTSPSTWEEDLQDKKDLYEMMGVREYFLFDPLDEYLRPRLQGFQLTGDGFHPLQPIGKDDLRSEQLGLVLRAAGDELRLFDVKTGRRLLPPEELAGALEREVAARQAEVAARQAEVAARQAEAAARQAAEAEIARLRAELERLRSRGQ